LKIRICFFLCLTLVIGFGCGKKMPLPTVESSPESFGANDTSYTHLNLTWDAQTIGYDSPNPMTPVDIAIGEDGYLFVADSANNRVITVSASGNIVTNHNLDSIEPVETPLGIDIDSKLNLLIVNGTNTVYVWNQYLNNIGVDSVLTGISDGNNLIFSADAAKIDSILGIHPFYIDENETSKFQGIAFGPSADSSIFVTDKENNRIIELKIKYSGVVKLKNGWMQPTFWGVYEKDIATYGSGAGTVDNPRGITVDENGNIYFTQLGGNFLIQKLTKQGMNYISQFTLYEHPIMDLNRFKGPFDISLDKNENIFVLDTESGKAFKFFNKGDKAGQMTNLGRKGLSEATFNFPYSIVISNNDVVYIADTGNHSIERFQFSVSEDDLPVEQPQ
jgi:sugar lactone lactonase YvrE